jgi:hypothetical protein
MRLPAGWPLFAAGKLRWRSGWVGKFPTAAGGQPLPDLQGNGVGDPAG